jgi:hypothetical protein
VFSKAIQKKFIFGCNWWRICRSAPELHLEGGVGVTNTWHHFFRRLAAVTVGYGAMSWSSAMCYAQIAADSATDPVYADGWQAGDNGGFGFTPWDFATDTSFSVTPGNQTINSTNPFNNIGTAWTLSMPDQQALPRAGRGFAPLTPGETLSMVVDNPTAEKFFKGYFIRFTDGPGNICYGNTACTPGTTPKERVRLQEFEYYTDGEWKVLDNVPGGTPTGLFDTDTAAAGMRVDFTLLTPTTYKVVMDPFGAAPAYTQTGTFEGGAGQVDWVEFTMFNTPTDTGSPPTTATDLYISSMRIIGNAPPGDYNNDGIVDAADYTVWRAHLGTAFQLPNEVSGVTPGMVTAEDYTAWRMRFGNSSGAGAGGAAAPEPSTFVDLVVAVTGLAFYVVYAVSPKGITTTSSG